MLKNGVSNLLQNLLQYKTGFVIKTVIQNRVVIVRRRPRRSLKYPLETFANDEVSETAFSLSVVSDETFIFDFSALIFYEFALRSVYDHLA